MRAGWTFDESTESWTFEAVDAWRLRVDVARQDIQFLPPSESWEVEVDDVDVNVLGESQGRWSTSAVKVYIPIPLLCEFVHAHEARVRGQLEEWLRGA